MTQEPWTDGSSSNRRMPDSQLASLRGWCNDPRSEDEFGYDCARYLLAEVDRLRRIENAARALKFSAYPAHGSGFVLIVSDGSINDLAAALSTSE